LTKMLLNFGSYNNTAILKPETLRLMIANQIGGLDAYGNKYGLGVGVEITDNGDTKEIFWAGGPYNSYFWIDYEKRNNWNHVYKYSSARTSRNDG